MENNKKLPIELNSIPPENFPENFPQVISDTFKDIERIDAKIKEAEKQADIAKGSADKASQKDVSFEWGVFGKKQEAIEALQDAVVKLSQAQSESVESNKMILIYQERLTNALKYLFALGVNNIAANRIVVRELKLKLQNASKEELSELAKNEIQTVILQLRAQEDLYIRIKGHDDLFRKHKSSINEMKKNIGSINTELENKCSIEQLNKELKNIQNSIDNVKEEFAGKCSTINNKLTQIEVDIENLKKKSFVDSTFFKIIVGASAITALALHFLL